MIEMSFAFFLRAPAHPRSSPFSIPRFLLLKQTRKRRVLTNCRLLLGRKKKKWQISNLHLNGVVKKKFPWVMRFHCSNYTSLHASHRHSLEIFFPFPLPAPPHHSLPPVFLFYLFFPVFVNLTFLKRKI